MVYDCAPSETKPGIFTFRLNGIEDVTFQITNMGKLGIHFPQSMGYDGLLKRVMSLLVAPDGSSARKLGDPEEAIVRSTRKNLLPDRENEYAEIREEIAKIREDHVSGHVDRAFVRANTLTYTILPEDLKREIMPIIIGCIQEMPKKDEDLSAFHPLRRRRSLRNLDHWKRVAVLEVMKRANRFIDESQGR